MSRKAAFELSLHSRLLVHRNDLIKHNTPSASHSLETRCFCPSSKTAFRYTRYHDEQDAARAPSDTIGSRRGVKPKAKQKEADKEFFLDLLSSAATKRESKQYLSRFKALKPSPPRESQGRHNLEAKAELSGSLNGTESTSTKQPLDRKVSLRLTPNNQLDSQEVEISALERLHVALVKLKDPHLLDDSAITGVAQTLSQLSTLGTSCCVVIDVGAGENDTFQREIVNYEADRLAATIDHRTDGSDSRRLDSIIALDEATGTPTVLSRNSLLSPLSRGRIVVVTPIAYTLGTQTAVSIPADDVVLALAKDFAGLTHRSNPNVSISAEDRALTRPHQDVSLDRLIILDPLGAIPSPGIGPQDSHVFVNLQQEYGDIKNELSTGSYNSAIHIPKEMPTELPLGKTNPLSKFVEDEVVSLSPKESLKNDNLKGKSQKDLNQHIANLTLLQRSLSLLPPSSSGLITTAIEAASLGKKSPGYLHSGTVGTRQRNPLIHNLLTDRPVYSASLPLGRRPGIKNGSNNSPDSSSLPHSTFVKLGMPLTVIPDPRIETWSVPRIGETRLKLDDSRIDLPRLVHLINDSFDRELDVKKYLERVNERIAGLIIAGEYEGGAILTWETPPGIPDDGSPQSMARMVPYLDKFAVLKRSQGAGGVADIVFNAMVRTCFPNGVCWRSRMDNPVNKWYFERSRGTWKLPGTNWTMFWTTPNVPENEQLFEDYKGVCRSIEPSWADKKEHVD